MDLDNLRIKRIHRREGGVLNKVQHCTTLMSIEKLVPCLLSRTVSIVPNQSRDMQTHVEKENYGDLLRISLLRAPGAK